MMNRRGFIGALSAGGAAALGGGRPRSADAEPPPETTRIRLFKWRSICVTPQFIADDLLKTEGFTDVQYIETKDGLGGERLLADGDIDINSQFSAPLIVRIDAGAPVTFLGGLHVGFELFANDTVRAIPDLRGKIVAVPELGSVQHVFLSAILAYVGFDPRRDVKFVTPKREESLRLLADRGIDAYLGFPPDPQELRAKRVGHVVLNSTQDRPWSQYFCCMVAGNRAFVRKHPIATKRGCALCSRRTRCARSIRKAPRAAPWTAASRHV
jgi:NitT/TauT family transport system substrate-binding protein